VPIVKANHIDHLRENIDVFDFELDDNEMRKLDNLNEAYSALGAHRLSYQ
jgi:2,5-diketo-D-gluconate reductase A